MMYLDSSSKAMPLYQNTSTSINELIVTLTPTLADKKQKSDETGQTNQHKQKLLKKKEEEEGPGHCRWSDK